MSALRGPTGRINVSGAQKALQAFYQTDALDSAADAALLAWQERALQAEAILEVLARDPSMGLDPTSIPALFFLSAEPPSAAALEWARKTAQELGLLE